MVYFISIDCEATGLRPYEDQIVQFGAVIEKINDDCTFDFVGSFCEYVKPTYATMSKGALDVTGITMEMLENKENIQIVLNRFSSYLNSICTSSEPRILLAYNGIAYDIPLIVADLNRVTNVGTFFRCLKLDYIVDILLWCRESIDKTCLIRKNNGRCSYTLTDVFMATCKTKLDGAHCALVDCQAVIDILKTDSGKPFCKQCISFLDDDTIYGSTCPEYMVNPKSLIDKCLSVITKTKKRKRSHTIVDMFQKQWNRQKP